MENVCRLHEPQQGVPKGSVPFAHIDQEVDSTSGYKTLCFLDAYSEYHQIAMKESNQLTTSFITPLDCTVMS
jgi:hypothetical protein